MKIFGKYAKDNFLTDDQWTITYLFFDAVNEILLSEYGELIPEDMKNDVESLIKKANENIYEYNRFLRNSGRCTTP